LQAINGFSEEPIASIFSVEAINSSKTFVTTYKATGRHDP
jgi:hypothetical protein